MPTRNNKQATVDRHAVLFAAFLVFAATLIYCLAAGGELVLDSNAVLTSNDSIKIDGGELEQWRRSSLGAEGSDPPVKQLAMLTFGANHVLSGELAPNHLRLTNVVLHLLTAGVLFALLQGLFSSAPELNSVRDRAVPIALLAGVLWLVHPLHVSTVLYAVQRTAQLTTLFTLLGLWVFVTYRSRWARRTPLPGELGAALLWSGLCLAGAAYSRENGGLLGWLVIAVELCFFRGMWNGRHSRTLQALCWLGLLLPPLLLAGAAVFDGESITASYAGRRYDPGEHLLTQPRLLWHYLGWLVLPPLAGNGIHHDDIALSYGLLQPVTTALALIGWFATLLVAWRLRRRLPLLLFALLFYLMGHSIESGVLAPNLAYEYRNYLPSVGFFALLAWFLLGSMARSRPALVVPLSAGLCLILLVLLAIRAQPWSDELQLSAAALLSHPQSVHAHGHYAGTLLRRAEARGDAPGLQQGVTLAREQYERMYQLDPDSAVAVIHLYYIDSRYFPALAERYQWLKELRRISEETPLTGEDYKAFHLLNSCLLRGICQDRRDQIEAVYEIASEHHGARPQLPQLRAQLLAALWRDPEGATRLLRANLSDFPAHRPSLVMLMELEHAVGNGGAVIELSRRLLEFDSKRREMALAKSVFEDRAP